MVWRTSDESGLGRVVRELATRIGVEPGRREVGDDRVELAAQRRIHAGVPGAVALDVDEGYAALASHDTDHLADGPGRGRVVLEEEACPGVVKRFVLESR